MRLMLDPVLTETKVPMLESQLRGVGLSHRNIEVGCAGSSDLGGLQQVARATPAPRAGQILVHMLWRHTHTSL